MYDFPVPWEWVESLAGYICNNTSSESESTLEEWLLKQARTGVLIPTRRVRSLPAEEYRLLLRHTAPGIKSLWVNGRSCVTATRLGISIGPDQG